MPTVRTTIQPDVTLEVSDAEYTDLERQGLLLVEADPKGAATPAPAAAPAKTPTAAKSKD
jgi:hypothetical protein